MSDMDQYIWDETDPAITPGRRARRSKRGDEQPAGNEVAAAGNGPVAKTATGNVLRKEKAAPAEDDEEGYEDDIDGYEGYVAEETKEAGRTKVAKRAGGRKSDDDENGTKEGNGRKEEDNGRVSARAGLRALLSYRWIMKNVSFFLFLAALAVIYIYNGHYADKIVRDINKTNKELKELQYEYKTLKSEVMFRSKQSELAKAVEPFGLKELTQPPVVLVDSSGR